MYVVVAVVDEVAALENAVAEVMAVVVVYVVVDDCLGFQDC